jgi:predicted anti-sigma-YlaC factor YlaD
MTCKEIRELMPDLAAGLSAANPGVEEHVHSCSGCAGELEEFRKTMVLLDEWTAPEPSPYFDTRLRARLREEMAAAPKGWMAWFRKPALAVSLAVLMVLSISLFRTDSDLHPGSKGQMAQMAEPGTAVGDLQALDKNSEIYTDFDLLDDLQVQQNVNANP